MSVVTTYTRLAGVLIAGLMLCMPAQAETTSAQSAVPSSADLLEFQSTDHVLGNRDAKVRIIEYASLSCPHCMQYHLETFPELKKRYIDTGKVAFAYRHFPFNSPALHGAMLAECAGSENFYKYINVLMKAQDKWAFTSDHIGALRGIARIGGMSEEDFNSCMADTALQERIAAQMQRSAVELHIQSTPTTFVNGEKLSGFHSIDELAKHIDPLLGDSAE